jgi:hypothetical protein
MRVLEKKNLGHYFFYSFSLFFKNLCEASRRCFWLSERCGCFVPTGVLCNHLRGTTSGRHLCSVRTVNPIGLSRFPPARPTPSFILFFLVFIVVLYVFPCFLCVLFKCTCPFCNLSPPQVWFSTLLLFSFSIYT